MRVTINKRSSTKPERIFIEILKKHHIPFKHRVKMNGLEIDFIIGIYAIEIDGHQQSSVRNKLITDSGFQVIHYHNNALRNNRLVVEQDLLEKINIWHSRQESSQQL